ncbi:gap junction protein alpha 4 [Trichomycterus rosablanca]|uniref:gap junction protein alpha 4 n=1 Tax=Trichomycterus rosablanca TaxID=2290929 RepID=UPI002F35EF05
MSRADWGFLERLLEEGQEYSTSIGRVWLTVLFLFRMLVLGTAAESAWDDEQLDFICNTKQPGCESVCYDKAFPISHFRYFVLQVIFVSTPTIFYFGYVALRGRQEAKSESVEEERHERPKVKKSTEMNLEVIQEEDENETKEVKKTKLPKGPPRLKGKLLGAYATSLALKVVLEVGFIVGLWFLYGFVVPAKYECQRSPCPHTVDCFVSRPTEKTIFTIYTQIVAAISVLLNIVELFYLLQLAITHHLEKKYQNQELVIAKSQTKLQPSELQDPTYQNGHPLPFERNDSYTQSTVAQTETDHADNTLPSYVNCIGVRTHRGYHHKQIRTKHNKSNSTEKHSTEKHYV